jgi:hypothetical protein
MNTTGLVKDPGALFALAMLLSACGSGSTVEPSAAALNATYVGRTLFINGRPVTAARLRPLPTYATIAPVLHAKSNTFEYSTITAATPAFSTIRRALRRSV